jgi:hypothetical protein
VLTFCNGFIDESADEASKLSGCTSLPITELTTKIASPFGKGTTPPEPK